MAATPATSNAPNPDSSAPKPDAEPPWPSAGPLGGEPRLNDSGVRLLGIPFFGIVIPNLTGLFGPFGPRDAAYWLGYLWFVALSFLIWHGNRHFLILQRRHYDWFDHPWRKLMLLLFANVFYTAPVSVAMLLAWYRGAGFAAPDWPAIRVVTLANVICVVFVTHAYETVYLIQQRQGDLLAVAQLQRARAEAELAAIKSQVDPHFLFNSLNALVHLIPRDAARAVAFTERLAEIYRYILSNRQRDLVPLEQELAFVAAYAELLRLRFGDAVRVACDEAGLDGYLVPPISLQLLVENAVKHNAFDRAAPLEVRLQLAAGRIQVENGLRPKTSARPSSRVGLSNLDQRCRRVLGQGLEVRSEAGRFRVTLPLLRTAA